jgi:hypothetical protein
MRVQENAMYTTEVRPNLICLSAIALCFAAAVNAVAAGPPAPNPLTPANGAGVQTPVPISWSAVSDPAGIIAYSWQVSTSSSFSPIAFQSSTNGQTQDTVSGLSNGKYFWRVQAVNGNFVDGAYSATESFTVTGAGPGSPATPVMQPPKGYSTFHPLETMTFNWSAVPGAATYLFQYSTDSTFPQTTRGQFNNLPTPTMSFATPDQGNYFARAFTVSSSGVLSPPSNVITFSIFYSNPLPAPPSPVSPANGSAQTLPVTLTWTDVPNPQPSGYEVEIAKDSAFNTIEEDDPQLNEPSRTVLSLTPGTKFWRVRSTQGDASPTTGAVTAWSAAGTFTMPATPPVPVSVTFTQNPLPSGNTVFIQIQLSVAVGAGGATVQLTSSNSSALPLPATISMPPNLGWTQMQIQAGSVSAATPVTVTATLNSASASTQITVQPPTLKSISFSANMITSNSNAQLNVALTGQAPPGGAVLNLSSNSPAVIVPPSATIPAGASTGAISLQTAQVAVNTPATITATWNGTTVQTQVTVTPQGKPVSITLNPAVASAPAGSFVTVTVDSAPASDETLQLTNSNPAVATVPGDVIIPAGSTTGGVGIVTSVVTQATVATISVSGGGVTVSANLTVEPPPPPPQNSTLLVQATGRSGETVSSSPAGIQVAVGSNQSAQFATGTSVTLSVSDGRNAIWSGACSSGGNKQKTCTLTVNTNLTVNVNVQ